MDPIKKAKSYPFQAGLLCLLLWLTGCNKPDAPEYYGLQDIRVGSMTGSQTTLSAIIKFYNPNSFSLQLKKAEVDVSVNGRPAGHSILDSTILIPKKDTFFVPVSLQVDLQHLFSNALQLLMEKQVTITLDGKVKLKRGMIPINRPFHYESKQDLSTLMPSGF
ncbi:LEA/WHy family protein [Flavitalea flava]